MPEEAKYNEYRTTYPWGPTVVLWASMHLSRGRNVAHPISYQASAEGREGRIGAQRHEPRRFDGRLCEMPETELGGILEKVTQK